MRRDIRLRAVSGYGFISPALIFYIFFFGFPVIFSLAASFRRWNMLVPLFDARFLGWDNFEFLLQNEMFLRALLNTSLYAVITVCASLGISLFLAVLINSARFPVLWRFLFFTPVVTPSVAIGTIWNYLYRPNNGLLNQILGWFGIRPVYWLTDGNVVLFSVMLVAIWAGIGGSMLIFTAALKNIPNDYYDAAKIDGAGIFRRFFSITIPLIQPTLLFLMATGMIGAWQVFDLPFIMGRNAPAMSIMTVSWYIYETAFGSMRMGRASAGAFLLFIIIFVITLLILRAFRKGGYEGFAEKET